MLSGDIGISREVSVVQAVLVAFAAAPGESASLLLLAALHAARRRRHRRTPPPNCLVQPPATSVNVGSRLDGGAVQSEPSEMTRGEGQWQRWRASPSPPSPRQARRPRLQRLAARAAHAARVACERVCARRRQHPRLRGARGRRRGGDASGGARRAGSELVAAALSEQNKKITRKLIGRREKITFVYSSYT